jgi:cystathionine gamma-synthase
VTDIEEAAHLAHGAGAVLAVDGTCAPPCTTRALRLGADIVMHSATKYLNGHSDVTAGVLAFADPSARPMYEPTRRYMGAHLGAFEAWLLMRGLRTLPVRFARQSETALRLAGWLEGHPAVDAVSYPGLPSHPQHAIAARQMTGGFGGMLSIHVHGGFGPAQRLVTGTQTFINATSLGSVESLIEHRKAVEGPASTTPDGLVRLSIGLEPHEVLKADLAQALSALTNG